MTRVRILWVAAVVLAALVAGLIVLGRDGRPRIAGIYLAQGGMDYAVITADRKGGWRIEHAGIQYGDEEWEWTISYAKPRLVIRGQPTPKRAKFWNETPENLKTILVLAPSRSIPGDWDAVRFGDNPRRHRDMPPGGYPLKRRVPYLHRLSDTRIVDCFRLAKSGDYAAAYETARALLRSYSADPCVRALYLGVAVRNADVDEVTRRIDEWYDDFETRDDPYLQQAFHRTRTWLRSRLLSASGRNAYDLFAELLGDNNIDLPTRLRRYSEALAFEECVAPMLFWPSEGGLPNSLEIQVSAKVALIMAVFRMIQGRRQESATILTSIYRMGQLWTDSPELMATLIGSAVREIAARGLVIHAMNCCETEAEFRLFWEALERLEQLHIPRNAEELTARVFPLRYHVPSFSSNVYQWRYDCADSRFELLRMATAAKYRWITQGGFPQTAAEFAPLLPDGLPDDPCGDGPLRFRAVDDSLVCYAIGPDKRDDRAAIEYDPTNGLFSAGDILVRVPRERRYPFPRDGVRAASVEDLLRQFPHNLPPDLFARPRGKPLGTTVTATGNLYVYSYGPDCSEFRSTAPRLPPVHYDPTNGTVSRGDLFIRLPRP